MSYARDDDLQRALERLTIQDVWRRAGLPDAPREGNILVKSPFREDRRKSFSIFKLGAVAKDQSNGEVFSVFKFAGAATKLEGKELVDRLCEWAGVSRTVHVRQQLRDVTAAIAAGQPVELPTELKRVARRLEKQAQLREAEDRLEGQLLMSRAPKTEVRALHAWSELVRARYLEGWHELRGDEKRLADWASDRGWPLDWVKWLVEEGLISMPWVPWTVPAAKYAQRGKAFRVDAPVFEMDPVTQLTKRESRLLDLKPIGYHQRYFILGEKGEDGVRAPGEKQWTYVPYMPTADKQRTAFQQEMVALELARGGEIGRACLAGLPFLMGDFAAPRFLVISEGQWDAVSFAGACGWLAGDTAWPPGAAVMGVRGNEGSDTMLAYWRPWLALHKPAVLVLADNDVAGRRWVETKAPKLGLPDPPTLEEKLTAAGARRVYVWRVRPEFGKDFNDYWKAKKPSPTDMAEGLRKLGFIDSQAGWA